MRVEWKEVEECGGEGAKKDGCRQSLRSVFNCDKVLVWGALAGLGLLFPLDLRPSSAPSGYQFSEQTTSASDSTARKTRKQCSPLQGTSSQLAKMQGGAKKKKNSHYVRDK